MAPEESTTVEPEESTTIEPEESTTVAPEKSTTMEPQCQLMPGMNLDGSNLKSSADSTSSAEACCSLCQSSAGCVGFTWVHETEECWLKSAVDSPRDEGCDGCLTS